ncbi:class F sortase [Dactylosporangium aurantiacum]|uniref:class F sortase n=1 Tax=Dactylosporangium aurantiacum TaxID=35754 RepID=UPI001FE194CE|nr:class F sortase [Dactylosporangium aurantiacum]MDG6110455.1 class F sortase [Dactylosporangium aurantiacum]
MTAGGHAAGRHARHRPRHLLVRANGTWRGGTVVGVISLVVAGVSLIGAGYGTPGPPPVVESSGSAGLSGTAPHAPASPPVRLSIHAIGVEAPVERVDVDRDGILVPPSLRQPSQAGWYQRGPTPGEAGNAVIVGHVDTAGRGPAVFYQLGRLKPGDEIGVTRRDGSTVTFQVDGVRLYSKRSFPAGLVYGPAERSQLRLITCGGTFDRATSTYSSNTVVTATMLSWRS